MATRTSIIITSISIMLLVIYGVDAVIGGGTGQGFLPFDHIIRGVALGIPSVALPIIAFFISKREPSKILGILIIISGMLTVIGSVAFLVMQSTISSMEPEKNRMSEFAPVIAVGIFVIALGIIKTKKSS
ncbi:MAG TPA: hypothetical protein VLD38_08690 [Nitrosopumilaceae archaeon]|nr:hypothetical protein [Nitrosopumilaceae archaeon]